MEARHRFLRLSAGAAIRLHGFSPGWSFRQPFPGVPSGSACTGGGGVSATRGPREVPGSSTPGRRRVDDEDEVVEAGVSEGADEALLDSAGAEPGAAEETSVGGASLSGPAAVPWAMYTVRYFNSAPG